MGKRLKAWIVTAGCLFMLSIASGCQGAPAPATLGSNPPLATWTLPRPSDENSLTLVKVLGTGTIVPVATASPTPTVTPTGTSTGTPTKSLTRGPVPGISAYFPDKANPFDRIPNLKIGNRMLKVAFKQLVGNGRALAAAFNPGQTLFAVASANGLHLFSTDDWSRIETLPYPDYRAVKFSPDGKNLLLLKAANLTVIRTATYETVFTYPVDCQFCSSFEFWDVSPDGAWVAIAGWGKIAILRMSDGGLESEIPHPGIVTALKYMPDGGKLAVGNADYSAEVWDPSTLVMEKLFRAGKTPPAGSDPAGMISIAFSPDGTMLAGQLTDGTVAVYGMDDEKMVRQLAGEDSGWGTVRFVENRKVLSTCNGREDAAGRAAGSVRVWNIDDGSLAEYLEPEDAGVYPSADGSRLVYFTADAVEIRGRAGREVIAALPGFARFTSAARMLEDGTILTGGYLGSADVFSVSGEVIRSYAGNPAIDARHMAFSPDGGVFAALDTTDRMLKIFSTSTGLPVMALGRETPTRLLFSPDGKFIAYSAGVTHIWNIPERRKAFEFRDDQIGCMAFSADSRFFANCDRDGYVQVWELGGGTLQRLIDTGSEKLEQVAFSEDNKMLASRNTAREFMVWQLYDGRDLMGLAGFYSPTDPVKVTVQIYFTGDDHFVVAGYTNGIVEVLCTDGMGGSEIRTADGLTGIEISPDGKYMLLLYADSTIQLWDLPLGG